MYPVFIRSISSGVGGDVPAKAGYALLNVSSVVPTMAELVRVKISRRDVVAYMAVEEEDVEEVAEDVDVSMFLECAVNDVTLGAMATTARITMMNEQYIFIDLLLYYLLY